MLPYRPRLVELDTDRILSTSQQWQDLEQKWGEPVDLDAADSTDAPGRLSLAPSNLALNRTTFDSAKIIYRLKRVNSCGGLSDTPSDYKGFRDGIHLGGEHDLTPRPFSVDGRFLRQNPVDDIYDKNGVATSTFRRKRRELRTAFGDVSSVGGRRDRPLSCRRSPTSSTVRESVAEWERSDGDRCDEFSRVVQKVGRELVYLQRHGRPRSSRRKLNRSDVRLMRWNILADESIYC